jgi:ceramide glucosyltransferase
VLQPYDASRGCHARSLGGERSPAAFQKDAAVPDALFASPLALTFAALALLSLASHLASLALAWPFCRPGPDVAPPAGAGPAPAPAPLTVARVLCGAEPTSRVTLEATMRQTHPDLRVLFCVARESDPVVPLVREAMAAWPQVDARLLIGEDVVSANPKLNNMMKAWRAAATDQILFLDSNLVTPDDYARRVQQAWRPNAGLVSAPPLGDLPGDWPAEVEAAFLNTHAARWQYAAGAAGLGFAQGKTLLFSKSALALGDLSRLGDEPAEDAAATRIARAQGKTVALAAPPAAQWLGRRPWSEVWRRQVRWARLRRATFPALYALELAAGAALPLACAIVAATLCEAPEAAVLFAGLWWGAEWAFAAAAGWPAGPRAVLAFMVRDALLPVLWALGWSGASVAWRDASIALTPAGRPASIRAGGASAWFQALWRRPTRRFGRASRMSPQE